MIVPLVTFAPSKVWPTTSVPLATAVTVIVVVEMLAVNSAGADTEFMAVDATVCVLLTV